MADGNDGKDVVVRFGAQIEDLKDKLDQVGGLFKTLTERFAVMAAVVGGGSAFKSFIDETNKLTGETVKLSRTLGVTGDEAAALNTALNTIGSDSETYTGAFLKFNRALKTNSEGLKELGVDVDGFKNGQKSSNEVFMESLRIVAQYKPGIDQTQIAMKLFGRNVADVQQLLKLNSEEIEHARKKNEELNLTISQESVEASKKYKRAMNDVQEVLHGLEKTIGEAVIPLFTESANKLAAFGPMLVSGMKVAVDVFVDIFMTVREIVSDVIGVVEEILGGFRELFQTIFGRDGPGAMQIFKNALAVVHIAFIAFRVGFEEVVNYIKTGLAVVVNGFITFASIASRALRFDFAGAKEAWRTGLAESNRILEEGLATAVKIAEKGRADIDKAAMKAVDGGPEKARTQFVPKGGDKTADFKQKKSKDTAAAEAAAEQALLKAEQEAIIAMAKAHNKELQKANDEAYKDGLKSTEAYYAERQKLMLQDIDDEISAKKKEFEGTVALEESTAKPEQKLKFQAQEEKLNSEINLLLLKRGETIRENGQLEAEALTKLADAKSQFESDQAKAIGEGRVAAEQAQLAQMKTLREISAQDAFAIEKKLEDDNYQIILAALENKRSLIKGSELEQQKARESLQLEEEAAERAHQSKITSISNAAEVERERFSTQAQQQIESSFSTMLNGLMAGTTKLTDVFRQFAVNISNIFTNLIAQNFAERIFNAAGINKAIGQGVDFITSGIAKMVAKFIGGEVAQTAAATEGASNRTLLNQAEAAASAAADATATEAAVLAETTQTGAATAADTEKSTSAEIASGIAIEAQQTESIAAVFGYAAEAAVAAMASVAAIPFVGWAMAPEVAAATYATGLGFLASAAGGWGEVPEDQLAQIHKKEMILPAPIADGIRDMVQRGKGSVLPTALPESAKSAGRVATSAAPSAVDLSAARQALAPGGGSATFNVTAIDALGVKDFFMKHGHSIAKSIQNQGRNFVGVSAT